MPKIISISSRPPRSYDPLSLEDSKLNYNALYIDTSPVWNGQETQKFYDTTQDAVFLNAAMERMLGGSKLRLPSIDHFQAHGRTIYNANNQSQHYIPFHSKTHSFPYKNALKVTNAARRASLKSRSQPHPYHPQRRTHSTKNDDPFCLSTGDKQRHRGPQTLFLAVTKTNEVQLIPDRCISLVMEPEKTGYTSDSSDTSNRSDESMNEGGSRSPTPSLSRSDSVNSSPTFDSTINWKEGLDGLAREGIIPLNYGAADHKRPNSNDECIEVKEPLGHPFDLLISGSFDIVDLQMFQPTVVFPFNCT